MNDNAHNDFDVDTEIMKAHTVSNGWSFIPQIHNVSPFESVMVYLLYDGEKSILFPISKSLIDNVKIDFDELENTLESHTESITMLNQQALTCRKAKEDASHFLASFIKWMQIREPEDNFESEEGRPHYLFSVDEHCRAIKSVATIKTPHFVVPERAIEDVRLALMDK